MSLSLKGGVVVVVVVDLPCTRSDSSALRWTNISLMNVVNMVSLKL